MNVPRGILWFAGTTQVKKTTHAVELAFAAKDAGAGPITVLDSMGVWNFRTWNRVDDRPALYQEIFGRRRDTAIMPFNWDDVNAMYRAIHKMATHKRPELRRPRPVVLMDESRQWISKSKRDLEDIGMAARAWAHSEGLYLFTTQRIKDIHGDFLAIECEIRIYRTVEGDDTDRLWDDYRIKKDDVINLPNGSYITIRNGVVQRGGKGCPIVTAA